MKPSSRGSQRKLLQRPRVLAAFNLPDVVAVVRAGVPATQLNHLSRWLGVHKETLYIMLGMASSTVERKLANGDDLSIAHAERVVGLTRMLGITMARAGLADGQGEEVAGAWLRQWLETPVRELGGQAPKAWLDSVIGQMHLHELLDRAAPAAK